MNFLRMHHKLVNLDNVKSIEMNEELKTLIIDYMGGGTDITMMKDVGELNHVYNYIANSLTQVLTKPAIKDSIETQSNGAVNNES